MASHSIDGTIEEAALKRRRRLGSVYEKVVFRLPDGSSKTWAKAVVMNDVADYLTPGTSGRFYLYTAIDHRGIAGIRTSDGREIFNFAKINENVSIWVVALNAFALLLYVTVLEKISLLALVLMILGVPMYFVYRNTRLAAERHFAEDAGFRLAAATA